MRKRHTLSLLLTAGLCTAAPTFAHHGSNGQFDMAQTMTVEGVVTKARFVNPHSYIYFDVTPVGGGEAQEWRCEHRSGSIMKRAGWTTDMFKVGAKVSIIGAPARREEFGCYIRSVSIDGGAMIQRNSSFDKDGNMKAPPRELETEDGTPNFAGNWAYVREARGARPAGQDGGMGAPDAGMGAPPERGAMGAPPAADAMGGPPRGGGGLNLTDAGQIASAGFDSEDNPRFHCQATNIFHDFWFDEHVNAIEQTPNMLKITYGFMDIVREIHIDGEFPKTITPSRSGYSIAKWDDDTLVVTTKGFSEGYLDGRTGGKHSDQFVAVEKFAMSKDGKTLSQDYEGTDPLYFNGTYSGSRTVTHTTDAFDPYDCDDLTQEIVDGF